MTSDDLSQPHVRFRNHAFVLLKMAKNLEPPEDEVQSPASNCWTDDPLEGRKNGLARTDFAGFRDNWTFVLGVGFLCLGDLLQLKNQKWVSLNATVWKFNKFSAIQNLREINYCKFWVSKTFLEALEFVFCKFEFTRSAKFPQN